MLRIAVVSSDHPKRVDHDAGENALGRIGADVTVLAYGAMKLQGTPGGPAISDAEAAVNIGAGIEDKLRRTGTDGLDLVQVHVSPRRSQLEADHTIETLATLQAAGRRQVCATCSMP